MPDQPPSFDVSDPMVLIHVGFAAVSLVLIGSGAMKILDPSGFVRFLADSSGRPVPSIVGRVAGGVEILVGLAALAVGGIVIAGLVAVVYAGFCLVVAIALRRGSPSCGCFGAVSSRPRRSHLAMNVASVVLAACAAVGRVPAVADLLDGTGFTSSMVVVVVMMSAAAGIIFVDTR